MLSIDMPLQQVIFNLFHMALEKNIKRLSGTNHGSWVTGGSWDSSHARKTPFTSLALVTLYTLQGRWRIQIFLYNLHFSQ